MIVNRTECLDTGWGEMSREDRLRIYGKTSSYLASFSTDRLAHLIRNIKRLHSGLYSHTGLLQTPEGRIFVKTIPVTDLELLPKNFMSSANLFELPLFYQYGGRAGFGCWRELIAHIMTNNWVISGECENFPLLYHWRLLPVPKPEPMGEKQAELLEAMVRSCGNSDAVRNRFKAIHGASTYLILFMECLPQTIANWMEVEIRQGEDRAAAALSFALNSNKSTTDFLRANNFIHFDSHLLNILTDGKSIYYSDFGLALSSNFELTQPESDFLRTHLTLDRCGFLLSLFHCLLNTLYGRDRWDLRIGKHDAIVLVDKERVSLPPSIESVLKPYFPVHYQMSLWSHARDEDPSQSVYPSTELEHLLDQIDKPGIS